MKKYLSRVLAHELEQISCPLKDQYRAFISAKDLDNLSLSDICNQSQSKSKNFF